MLVLENPYRIPSISSTDRDYTSPYESETTMTESSPSHYQDHTHLKNYSSLVQILDFEEFKNNVLRGKGQLSAVLFVRDVREFKHESKQLEKILLNCDVPVDTYYFIAESGDALLNATLRSASLPAIFVFSGDKVALRAEGESRYELFRSGLPKVYQIQRQLSTAGSHHKRSKSHQNTSSKNLGNKLLEGLFAKSYITGITSSLSSLMAQFAT